MATEREILLESMVKCSVEQSDGFVKIINAVELLLKKREGQLEEACEAIQDAYGGEDGHGGYREIENFYEKYPELFRSSGPCQTES
jgi:hypothetical protein